MNRGDAVFTVRENGKESYFYGKLAGDYQTPFDVLTCLQNEKEQGIPADITMDRLIYNPEYPRDVVLDDPDEDPGPPVFSRVTSEQATASCSVTLDFDQNRVRYEPAGQDSPVQSLTIPMQIGMDCYSKSLHEAMFVPGNDYVKPLNELLGRSLLQMSAEWERMRGHNALFAAIENGKTSYYLTDYGGGAYNPAVLLQTLETARYELEDLGMRSDAAYLMDGALYSGYMANVPSERIGTPLFRNLSLEEGKTLSSRLLTCDDVAEQVTLDFDAEEISCLFSKTGEEIRVPLNDALEALKRAELNVENADDLESGTLDRLRTCARGEAPAMRMRG